MAHGEMLAGLHTLHNIHDRHNNSTLDTCVELVHFTPIRETAPKLSNVLIKTMGLC